MKSSFDPNKGTGMFTFGISTRLADYGITDKVLPDLLENVR